MTIVDINEILISDVLAYEKKNWYFFFGCRDDGKKLDHMHQVPKNGWACEQFQTKTNTNFLRSKITNC